MSLIEKNTALILIDLQKGWEHTEHWGGNRNNPEAEKVAHALLQTWRAKNLPVFHVIHSSTDPASELHESKPGFQMLDEFKPIDGEPLIIKHVNSGFIGTDLKERLENQKIDTLVIAGLTTNHCVSTTTRMAGNFGFDVYLISDATATFDRKGLNGEVFEAELVHQTALASLNEEFATVLDKNALLEIL
ncbi:cysteine hydrolase family protein [Roseivirga sp. E12]|uniref:cysteine hydrolase family protein n=1 Tax=Roseivirga sp. E12 TaxID=2819237 RepID=UPI001ABCE635|nr:cysteine hydrolase family protein [Roseivirga sp. E12]MBO3698454.1 cysteine hydrolase [Roseivirga sp. E12]